MKTYFETLAFFNRWANRRLFDAVSELSDQQFREPRGAYFGSVHATLNHVLVADRIWLRRITGSGEAPSRLDAILYEGIGDLVKARAAEDERLIRTVTEMAPERVTGTLRYRNVSGAAFEQAMAMVLGHIFNHQTHHRGQVHTLLTQFGCEAPPLDLIYFTREWR